MIPGIYDGMSDAAYHSGDGLSSTGAKTLLDCPAQYAYDREHPTYRDTFDHGHVIHELILGRGSGFVVVDGSRNSKAVKERVEEVRAEGKVPIKSDDLATARAIADAVHQHPEIGPIFKTGAAEQSVYATDPETGVLLRCRPDWLTETRDGRPVCVDVKSTAGDTHPWRLGKTISDYGYHISAAFYTDVLTLADITDPLFLLLFVSKTGHVEPRAVTLPPSAIARGQELTRRAIDTYHQCTTAGEWPCHHPAFLEVDIPAYAYHDKD